MDTNTDDSKIMRVIKNQKHDISHLLQTRVALGSADDYAFSPYRSDLSLRCKHCQVMNASSFTQLAVCGHCHSVLSKSDWRDAFVEALSFERNGGYNHGWLEALRAKGMGYYVIDRGHLRIVNDADRTKEHAYRVELERRKTASLAVTNHLRNNSRNAGLGIGRPL